MRPVLEMLEVGTTTFNPTMGKSLKEGWVNIKIRTRSAKALERISELELKTRTRVGDLDDRHGARECSCDFMCFGCICVVRKPQMIYKRWRRRWAVLKSTCIAFYTSPFANTPREVVMFDEGTTMEKGFMKTGEANAIMLRTFTWVVKMRTSNKDTRKMWFARLEHALDHGEGYSLLTRKRFDSFAPQRLLKARAQWFVDGAAYFSALYDALKSARSQIFIAGWWVCPDLYLKRPASEHPDSQLCQILKERAEAGVQIFVMMFKEIRMVLYHDSAYQKRRLLGLHPNVHVLRDPDLNAYAITSKRVRNFYWSHHEKCVVIDQGFAFVGGIDVCWGRYDNPHPRYRLVDESERAPSEERQRFNTCAETRRVNNEASGASKDAPRLTNAQAMSATISSFVSNDAASEATMERTWPGIDYANDRFEDFHSVHHPFKSRLDRSRVPRMPWHDIQCAVNGAVARDVARHFIQRWNVGLFLRHKSAKAFRMYKTTRKPTRTVKFSSTAPSSAKPSSPYSTRTASFSSAKDTWSDERGTGDSASSFESAKSSAGTSRSKGKPSKRKTSKRSSVLTKRLSSLAQFRVSRKKRSLRYPRLMPFTCTATVPADKMIPLTLKRRRSSFSFKSRNKLNRTKSGIFRLRSGTMTDSIDIARRISSPDVMYQGATKRPWSVHLGKLGLVGSSSQNGGTRPSSSSTIADFAAASRSVDAVSGDNQVTAFKSRSSASFSAPILATASRPMCAISDDNINAATMRGSCEANVQVVRSVGSWSACVPAERSIHNAYRKLIETAESFILIENQFFVSGMEGDAHVKNRILESLYQRILRAHNAGQMFKVIIVMPLIPGMAGRVETTSALRNGLRDVMHWQYRGICRGDESGGNALSLFERLLKIGIDPSAHVAVFGLRTHDEFSSIQKASGPSSFSRCGTFVTEQVYTHSKLLIVDDKICIIGSANINDRSMAGPRDSELALVVEDTEMVHSMLGGKPTTVGRFAHSLRRCLFAIYLGVNANSELLTDPGARSCGAPSGIPRAKTHLCTSKFSKTWCPKISLRLLRA